MSISMRIKRWREGIDMGTLALVRGDLGVAAATLAAAQAAVQPIAMRR